LEPILRFLVKNVADPRFGEMAAQVGQVVIGESLYELLRDARRSSLLTDHLWIDLYTPTLGQSPMIDDLFGKLRRRIDDELKFENELLLLKGALDMVLAQVSLFSSTFQ
jgi:U3 small nucleolar RNA-associated protein 15